MLGRLAERSGELDHIRRLKCAAISLLVGAFVAGCGGSNENDAAAPTTNEIGPVHVHGLGVNPADQALYVATHTGLYRIPEGESEASRVGDNYQDTMGFTVVGPDHFLGSGHPDARTDLPPFLGLIESDVAGEKWKSVSLLGRADFHVLEAAGERVYGFGSDFKTRREQFLVSDDGGSQWQSRDFPESLISLAINPDDPKQLIASSQNRLFESDDAGKSWQSLDGEPGLLAWPTVNSRYVIDKDGTVSVSDAVTSDWREVGGLGAAPAAFEAESAGALFAALHDGSIVQSSDGGQTWELRSKP